MSADEWFAWWEKTLERLKRQVKPGEFLRMIPGKKNAIGARAVRDSHEGVCRTLDASFEVADQFPTRLLVPRLHTLQWCDNRSS